MKKLFLLVAFLLFSWLTVSAQDLITKKNGEDIKAKVVEITPTFVKYILFDEPDGPIYTIYRSDVLLIRYSTGRNEVMTDERMLPPVTLCLSNEEDAGLIVSGMKYKQLKKYYDHKAYVPSTSDPYNPMWSGIASFFIPGLGQMICGEVGRGFAYLGGVAGCMVLTVVGGALSTTTSFGLPVCTASAVGILALEISSIVDAVQVARVLNMYERDLRALSAVDVKLYPSLNYIPMGKVFQPTAGLTLAVNF